MKKTYQKPQPSHSKAIFQQNRIKFNELCLVTSQRVKYVQAKFNDYGTSTKDKKSTFKNLAEEVSNEHPRA